MMIMNNDLTTRVKIEVENREKIDEITEKLVEGRFISERFGKYLGCLSFLNFLSNCSEYFLEERYFDIYVKGLHKGLLSLNEIVNLYGYEKKNLYDLEELNECFIQKMHLHYKKDILTQYHYLYDIAKEKFDFLVNKCRKLKLYGIDLK